MVEKLSGMKPNEVLEITDSKEYSVAITTAVRLKKSDKGEWIFNSSFNGMFVKRIK